MRHARVAAVLGALAFAGCGGPLIIMFEGGERLNPVDKTPPENTPVTVMVFLLKDKASFATASVEQLWTKEKAKAVLGGDQVGEVRERTINANDKAVTVNLGTIPADVRFIGVVAKLPKQDPPVTRHLAVPKDEADDYPFYLVDYKIEIKKK